MAINRKHLLPTMTLFFICKFSSSTFINAIQKKNYKCISPEEINYFISLSFNAISNVTVDEKKSQPQQSRKCRPKGVKE